LEELRYREPKNDVCIQGAMLSVGQQSPAILAGLTCLSPLGTSTSPPREADTMVDDVANPDGTNKRKHDRLEERNRVTVTVLSAPEAPEIERRSFYCWTHDLSVGGLKFCVHTHVPMGAILKLEVAFKEPAEEFRHIGQVMWEQEFDEDGILSSWLGVQFTETLGGEPRLEYWAHILEEKLGITADGVVGPSSE
jgi:hypothetical protein